MHVEHYKDYIATGPCRYLLIVDQEGKRLTTFVEGTSFNTIEEREMELKKFSSEWYKEHKNSPIYVATSGVPVYVDSLEHPLGLANILKGKRL